MKDSATVWILWTVIGLSIVSTVAIIYYSLVLLPQRIDHRVHQSIRAFGAAIELRFPKHRGLTDRVASLCALTGRAMHLSPSTMRKLLMAAQLRDIGLCAIPYSLVNKKSSFEWTEAEWDTYFRHTEVSGAMLELVPSLRELAPIVRFHHTDYEGGLGGLFPAREDIPIESRVLKAVCDYVWMTRNQGSLLARDSIKRESGKRYDPKVVEALLQVLTSNRDEPVRELTLV